MLDLITKIRILIDVHKDAIEREMKYLENYTKKKEWVNVGYTQSVIVKYQFLVSTLENFLIEVENDVQIMCDEIQANTTERKHEL